MPIQKLEQIWCFHYKSAILSHFLLICSLRVVRGGLPRHEWQVKFTGKTNCQGCPRAVWQVKVEKLWPGPSSFFFRWGKVFTTALHKEGPRKNVVGPSLHTEQTEGQRPSNVLKVTQLISSRVGTLMKASRVLNFVGFAIPHSVQYHKGQRNLKNSQSAVFRLWLRQQ